MLASLNPKQWIDERRHPLKLPVGYEYSYSGNDSSIIFVGSTPPGVPDMPTSLLPAEASSSDGHALRRDGIEASRTRFGRDEESPRGVSSRMLVTMFTQPADAARFQPDEDFARQLDVVDPLRAYCDRFHIPRQKDGSPVIYFAGNSLGLQPKSARTIIDEELTNWAEFGVDGHFGGKRPWYLYQELFRESGPRLVGARPGEVVLMNSLTVNLHLMMVSFYRPTPGRYKILIEDPCFPSDLYAAKTQLRAHGYNPDGALVVVKPRPGEHQIRLEDFEATLEREGRQIALVLLGGVNFVTGQVFDMARITTAAHRQGCTVGFDLAHAAGNVPLALHDWNVDFAAWCNYKYLNGGPGAVAGCFVHERHGKNLDLPRFAGWWGNDPTTRFKMQLIEDFVPREGADGWQVSNPPILALAPVKASYDLFDEVGMDRLRDKSVRLIAYLEFLLDRLDSKCFEVITPREPSQRGCQLSLLFRDDARVLLNTLHTAGVVCDYREPNVIRLAPVPLYNSFHDVWMSARILHELIQGAASDPSPSQGEG